MRKAISIKVTGAGHRSRAEVAARTAAEDRLRGSAELSAETPTQLSGDQREIYRWLYDALADAGVLSVLDRDLLTTAAITFDRLAKIDAEIELRGQDGLLDRSICAVRDVYFKQAEKLRGELCLSPSARAKLGAAIAATKKEQKDPLLEALADA